MTGPWRVLYPGPDGPENREKIRVCRVGSHQRCSASPMSAHRDPCQSSVPPCRGCQITRGSQKPSPRVGSQGAQKKLGTRETGGPEPGFWRLCCLRVTEGKLREKVPVVEIGVSPGPSPFLLPTERVGWGIRGGMAVGR